MRTHKKSPEHGRSGLLLRGNAECGGSIAAATVAATAAAGTATHAGFARLGLIHGETTTLMLLVMERSDGRICLGLAGHLHEAGALAAALGAVGGELPALDAPEL